MGEPDRLHRDPSPQMLLAFLRDHDAPCPICGYNLRGVTLSVCPECECPIELGVSSSSSYLGAWLLALLAFAMPLSFDLIVGTMMLIGVIMSAGENAEGVFLLVSLVTLTLVSVGMLWVLVARKRDWLRMPRRRQWRMAWALFAAVFVVHLMVGVGTFLIAN
ncbi:MAG: hypothetical protein JJ916_09565 [Phycisphaerales bacterium]|nr:hypothetical protein [Phycisphaerales bacterium]